MTFPTRNGDDGIFRGSISHLQERAEIQKLAGSCADFLKPPRQRLAADSALTFRSAPPSVRGMGVFHHARPETAESPLHMDHLLLTIIFTVQLWPLPSLSILPTWRSVPHIRNIAGINGAVNQDLCDLMPLCFCHRHVIESGKVVFRRPLLKHVAVALLKGDIQKFGALI